ncbi:serine/threonine-protein kinase [Paenibacillus daejeonensis]|uniref:serine/threonine-protein kinase n=1 Tax=Paenibacillus daejeonensis TaxID=135193 RepID=UPI0003655F01|nr:serine/threonine-protein kinase [Paenibacillus daejeonensis]
MIIINGVQSTLRLDKWRTLGLEGRNSTVSVCLDTQLSEVLVLKEITKDSLDAQQVDDYFLESKMLNASSHPHIMPIRHASSDESTIYITMPFYEKGSLNTLMDTKFLTPKEIIKYSLDFLSGLLFIHTKELLHLDIKPTNVVINDNDRAILTDFGLSRYLNENGLADQAMQYSRHRSPESYSIDAKSIKDDIYQTGLTLYRMANGNQVFKEQFELLQHQCNFDPVQIGVQVQGGVFPDRNFFLPHIPKPIRNIIKKALHLNPDRRYKNVLEIINALSKIDEKLNWEYTLDTNTNTHSWSLDEGNSITSVILDSNLVVSSTKLTKSSQRTRNNNTIRGTFGSLPEAFAYLEGKLE